MYFVIFDAVQQFVTGILNKYRVAGFLFYLRTFCHFGVQD